MSAFDIVLLVCGGVITLAALGVVYRMVVGPTILDRAISSDSLVTLVVLGMALYTAQAGDTWAGPAMLGLTGLAFVGTVTFARFVAREEPKQGYRPAGLREPSTDTGPHEAIHPDPEASPEELLEEDGLEDEAGRAAVAGGGTAAAAPSAQEPPSAGGDTGPADTGTDDSEAGFGAQPGSRGFDAGTSPEWPDDRREGRR